MKYDNGHCVISGFRRGPIFKSLQGLTLKMGPIGCPETSATIYQSALQNSAAPDKRSAQNMHSNALQPSCKKMRVANLPPPELCSSD
jgi:hypothetical protein